MKQLEVILYQKQEYSYPALHFLPFLHGYLHDEGDGTEGETQKKRLPAVIIVPGGAYSLVSPTEGEVVARKFYEMGYQAFVLTYTVNVADIRPLKWQPAMDLARALLQIRRNADLYGVDPCAVAVCGFSAGAHLAGTLAVHYSRPVFENLLKQGERAGLLRPDVILLCYPIITTGKYGHAQTFEKLLGKDAGEEERELFSLEKQVTKDTSPAFIWQTMTDEMVPVENSILYAQSCKAADVMCELHLFAEGKHGLSLADRQIEEKRLGDGGYTLRQIMDTYQMFSKVKPERLPAYLRPFASCSFPEFLKASRSSFFEESDKVFQADEEIARWPQMAQGFLRRVGRR